MNRRILGWAVVAALALTAVGAVVSPSAWASKGIHNFGGYSAPVVAAASATITVPAANTISCSSPKAATIDMWVALTRGQYAANAGFNVQCVHGSPIMFLSGAAGTLSFRFPVFAGDVISVTVSESAAATIVTAQDMTTTVSDSANSLGTTATTPTVVQFGATAISKTLPVFGPVTYSSITVDGAPIDSSTVTSRNLTRSHPPNVLPGPLSSGSFTLTET